MRNHAVRMDSAPLIDGNAAQQGMGPPPAWAAPPSVVSAERSAKRARFARLLHLVLRFIALPLFAMARLQEWWSVAVTTAEGKEVTAEGGLWDVVKCTNGKCVFTAMTVSSNPLSAAQFITTGLFVACVVVAWVYRSYQLCNAKTLAVAGDSLRSARVAVLVDVVVLVLGATGLAVYVQAARSWITDDVCGDEPQTPCDITWRAGYHCAAGAVGLLAACLLLTLLRVLRLRKEAAARGGVQPPPELQ